MSESSGRPPGHEGYAENDEGQSPEPQILPEGGEQDPAAAHSDPRSRLMRGWAAVAEQRLQPSGAVVLR